MFFHNIFNVTVGLSYKQVNLILDCLDKELTQMKEFNDLHPDYINCHHFYTMYKNMYDSIVDQVNKQIDGFDKEYLDRTDYEI